MKKIIFSIVVAALLSTPIFAANAQQQAGANALVDALEQYAIDTRGDLERLDLSPGKNFLNDLNNPNFCWEMTELGYLDGIPTADQNDFYGGCFDFQSDFVIYITNEALVSIAYNGYIISSTNEFLNQKKANNAEMREHIEIYGDAISKYLKSNVGWLPPEDVLWDMDEDMFRSISSLGYNVCESLVPSYINEMPFYSNGDLGFYNDCENYNSGYEVNYNDGILTIRPEVTPELGETIEYVIDQGALREYFAFVDNEIRQDHVDAFAAAMEQYLHDNWGFADGLNSRRGFLFVTESIDSDMLDDFDRMIDQLYPEYLAEIPMDPTGGFYTAEWSFDSGYTVYTDGETITFAAPHAALGEVIRAEVQYGEIARQYASERNNQRRADLEMLADAIYAYEEFSHGLVNWPIFNLETGFPTNIGSDFWDVNLCEVLVPGFMVRVPVDPLAGTYNNCFTFDSAYNVEISNDGILTLSAPWSELNERIIVERDLQVLRDSFANSRNIQRQKAVDSLAWALRQYLEDNDLEVVDLDRFFVPGMGPVMIGGDIAGRYLNLYDELVPSYLRQMPFDPLVGTFTDEFDYETGFEFHWMFDGRVVISAQAAELGDIITAEFQF